MINMINMINLEAVFIAKHSAYGPPSLALRGHLPLGGEKKETH